MGSLYQRHYRMTIGDLSWSDLRVAFEVERSLHRAPNTATFRLWNLGEASRGVASKAGTPLQLVAGYVDSADVLFSGEIKRSWLRHEPPDWITEIEARDGLTAWRAFCRRVYPRGAAVRAVVTALAGDMGLTLSPSTSALLMGVLPGPTVMAGRAEEELELVLRAAGYEWSIQDGALQVLRTGTADPRAPIGLSAETGMIGSPEVLEDGGATVRTLLQPRIRPGSIIDLTSRVRSGRHRAERVTHVGDSHGQDWTTEVEASLQ